MGQILSPPSLTRFVVYLLNNYNPPKGISVRRKRLCSLIGPEKEGETRERKKVISYKDRAPSPTRRFAVYFML